MTRDLLLTSKLDTLADLARGIDAEYDPDTADLLQGLAMITATAQSALRNVVAQARADGMSWEQIGRWTGTTRQAAQQRYGGAGAAAI